MAGPPLGVYAQIWEREGISLGSRVPSPIQYRPCFLPYPSLMTIVPLMSSVLGSQYGLWTDLASDAYELMRVWTLWLL